MINIPYRSPNRKNRFDTINIAYQTFFCVKISYIGFVDLVGTHPISARKYCDWHATGKWAVMVLQVENMSRIYWAYDFTNHIRNKNYKEWSYLD